MPLDVVEALLLERGEHDRPGRACERLVLDRVRDGDQRPLA
jgi:hypothetical protein